MYLSPAPLYHTAPQVSVAIALRMKSTAVVMEHFDPALYLELVGRYGVTHSQVVPTMFSRMLKLPDEVRAAADVSSLEVDHPRRRAVPGAGEGADDRVVRADPARVLRGDRGQRVHVHHFARTGWRTRAASGARVLSDIQILDDDGRPCPVGTSGTVWFAGATDFEYFNDPEKTATPGGTTGRRRRWATWGTWTRTGTCS